MLLLIIGAIIFSLFAFLVVYFALVKKLSKAWFLLAIFLELIVIFAIVEKQPAYFGFSGLAGLIMILIGKIRKK